MNIYVGNIARTVTEDALKNAFSKHGEVTSVKLIKDKFTGEMRGFGFVDMPNKSEAEDAIAKMNGAELEGQRLRVNEAREPEARTGGSAGAGRRPGGFGGPRNGDRGGGSRGGFGSRY